MAKSRLTSSVSRSRPMKLVRARGRLCLLAAPAGEGRSLFFFGWEAGRAVNRRVGRCQPRSPAADAWWPPRALCRTP